MTAEEFVEAVLFPAFNDNDDVTGVDPAPGGWGNEVLMVTVADGSVFHVTIARYDWTEA